MLMQHAALNVQYSLLNWWVGVWVGFQPDQGGSRRIKTDQGGSREITVSINSRELCPEQACKLSRVCKLARVKLSRLYCIDLNLQIIYKFC